MCTPRWSEGVNLHFAILGTRRKWVVSFTLWPIYPLLEDHYNRKGPFLTGIQHYFLASFILTQPTRKFLCWLTQIFQVPSEASTSFPQHSKFLTHHFFALSYLKGNTERNVFRCPENRSINIAFFIQGLLSCRSSCYHPMGGFPLYFETLISKLTF